ncbi:MAG: sugar phosphate isomerase/epimerase family protein [Planctomycetota bacterium]
MSDVVLTGFCDETCEDKNLERQFAVSAALGLEWISLRFYNLGAGVKNILAADQADLDQIKSLLDKYGLRVSSIGSPIGKIKLHDIQDGTPNQFRPFDSYLEQEVERICAIADFLQAPLVRGFSFYHPRGTSAQNHLSEAAMRLRAIAQRCQAKNLIFGLEVEANLIGQTGELVQQLVEQAGATNLVSIFDGANLVVQGLSASAVWREYLAMRGSLGWVHVKDYQSDSQTAGERTVAKSPHVDEESLSAFVPVGLGDAAYQQVLPDLKREVQNVTERLRLGGWEEPLVFLDLEPHLRKGGQFGGYSGPDGFGLALRYLCRMLDKSKVSYRLRDWPLKQSV